MQFDLFVWILFSDTALVRKEIQDETDRMTGKSKQISPVPIHLSIYSPNGKHFVDFELVSSIMIYPVFFSFIICIGIIFKSQITYFSCLSKLHSVENYSQSEVIIFFLSVSHPRCSLYIQEIVDKFILNNYTLKTSLVWMLVNLCTDFMLISIKLEGTWLVHVISKSSLSRS